MWAEIGGMVAGAASQYFGPQRTGVVNDYSLLSPDQQKLLVEISDYIRGGLKSGATGSAYSSYTSTPSIMNQAFDNGASLFGVGQDTLVSAITKQASGVPAYAFNAGQTSKLWNENFATPLMSSWRQNVAPLVKEGWNVPGMANSTLTARGMSDAASNYFATNVQPSLWNAYSQGMQNEFTSTENAAGRQLEGAQALGQLPYFANAGALALGQSQLTEQERILAALRGEESRLMPENNPWLQMALGLGTAQTSENIGFNGANQSANTGMSLAGIGNLLGQMGKK